MLLKTVDETCDFAAEWCGEKGAYPGGALSCGFAVPDCCIVRLNSRTGDLWHKAKGPRRPVLQHAAPLLGLLGAQDQILNPGDYAPDKNGIVPFVWENQHVWGYGFDPDASDQLFVTGDWCDGRGGEFETEWRPVPAQPEDALVCTLLINLCMQSDADWDEAVPRPEAARSVLWRHPAWSDFDGFWIDDARTLIYFSGWQVVRG